MKTLWWGDSFYVIGPGTRVKVVEKGIQISEDGKGYTLEYTSIPALAKRMNDEPLFKECLPTIATTLLASFLSQRSKVLMNMPGNLLLTKIETDEPKKKEYAH